jgi:hypothetical protein
LVAASIGRQCAWVPNPVENAGVVKPARQWLKDVLESDAPLWLMPTRVLRRKNIAEAILLTRWLRPEACLATIGGAVSPPEVDYANRLQSAARVHGWPLRLGLLARAGNESGAPIEAELTAAAEVVVVTSLQEGFGYATVDAAAAGRPLLQRRLSHVMNDLSALGFRFPNLYDEILVPKAAIDWRRELRRQRILFNRWCDALPIGNRHHLAAPSWWNDNSPVPFARLTLDGQIEVLAHPPGRSWLHCLPLNPWLARWRQSARNKRLANVRSSAAALNHLSPARFASRISRLVNLIETAPPAPPPASATAQSTLIKATIQSENFFPLLAAGNFQTTGAETQPAQSRQVETWPAR